MTLLKLHDITAHLQGWTTKRAYRAHEPEPLHEVAVMYLLFVVEKDVFC